MTPCVPLTNGTTIATSCGGIWRLGFVASNDAVGRLTRRRRCRRRHRRSCRLPSATAADAATAAATVAGVAAAATVKQSLLWPHDDAATCHLPHAFCCLISHQNKGSQPAAEACHLLVD